MIEFNLKGTYILIIQLFQNEYIKIGALGKLYFKKGFYYYIGSAMGDKGSSTIKNRVQRHLKPPNEKKIHWHIDYLLKTDNSKIVLIFLIPSRIKLECIIAKELITGADGFIQEFGCSDCNCPSHLLFLENLKSLKEIYKKGKTL